jgi:hypothetical protein
MEYEKVKCTCLCHTEGVQMRHIMACCDNGWIWKPKRDPAKPDPEESLVELLERRFVTADGVITWNEQVKGLIDSAVKNAKRTPPDKPFSEWAKVKQEKDPLSGAGDSYIYKLSDNAKAILDSAIERYIKSQI